jgi:hypothetical protein
MIRFALVLTAFLLVLGTGCRGREQSAAGGATATDTIAPAAPQPQETGTDAMTQTVELQDGRPEAEGGVLAGVETGVTAATIQTTATVTGTATTATTAPPPTTPPTTTTR